MSRSKSSQQWLNRHFQDPYVKRAQEEGWRSRAVFKLLEIQERDRLIKPGMSIVDLGAAPGSWSQAASKILQGRGQIIALDLLPMDGLPQVEFLQGDFQEEPVVEALLQQLDNKKVDLVLSDMAPNLSGQKGVDQPRMMYLAELVLDFSLKVLAPKGKLLIKLFHGSEFDEYLKVLRQTFKKVVIRKPKASRGASCEIYLLGDQLK